MFRSALQIIFFTLFITSFLSAQNYRIILDEKYSDWENIPGISDLSEQVNGVDFNQLKITNYNNFLFILLTLNLEINLQNSNDIILYIDTDNNPATGFSINGIGADLEYTFGDRKGKFYHDNTYTSISHEDIGLVTIPTVTSDKFEIEIKTNITIANQVVFPDSVIKIIAKNNISSGDIIPNENGGFEYHIHNTQAQSKHSYSIKKNDPDYLRILTYNVEKDRLFDSQNKEAHKRVFQAIAPDIIGFQEIYNHTAEETENLIAEFLPLSSKEQWYSAKDGSDIIVVSKFPIKQIFTIDGNRAFLIDLNRKYNKDLLFISAHTPCCNNEDTRQKEIDHFMAFVRDAKKEGGELTLQPNSPIIIVGDMNLVGLKQQQQTLITGSIVNQSIYGEAFLPDWDSTYFQDLTPITTNMPSTFTWYDEGSSYSPGRLDYIVFSNSVLNSENSFVLFPPGLPTDSLTQYNLIDTDAISVADHLPTVSDFSFYPEVSVKNENDKTYSFKLEQNYPNPFNPSTVIAYSIPVRDNKLTSFVTLKVYDILGREIATLVNQQQVPGNYSITFEGSNFTSGLYFYKLQSGNSIVSKKMILLK